MAPTKINPDTIRAFKDAESFYKWLGKYHDKQAEIWIKIHKVDSGFESITPKQAIDVVLAGAGSMASAKVPMTRAICSDTRRAQRKASGARSTSTTSRGWSGKAG